MKEPSKDTKKYRMYEYFQIDEYHQFTYLIMALEAFERGNTIGIRDDTLNWFWNAMIMGLHQPLEPHFECV